MKKNSTNLILAISIIILISILGLFVYVFNIIKNKNKHTSAVSVVLDKKIKEKANIDILEKKMSELGNTQEKINSYIVDTTKIDTFVEFLEKLGSDNNLNLTVKSVDAPKNTKNRVLVSLNILGSFTDLLKVIGILENSQYKISATSFYLNKELKGTESVISTIDKKIEFIPQKQLWQASISFSVLSI